MNLWLKHPRSKQPDSMMSLAVYGFIFSIVVISVGMIIAWIKKDMSDMSDMAMLVGAILTPSLGAYTVRKYSDGKHGLSSKTNDEPDEGDMIN